MVQTLDELVVKISYDVNKAGLNNYLSAQKKINRNTKQMIGLNNTLLKGLGRIAGVFGVGLGIGSLIKTYRELDLMRRSIEGLTGSTQDFEFLKQEAFRTATAIDIVAQSYKGFYAAANMSKFSKDEIQGMYGDLLTGLRGAGSTPERVKGALLAIEQMFSKGTIQAQELRLQLGNALPGAFELMASAVGVTTKELDTMMRKGLLPATKYVPLLIKEIKGYYETGFIKNVKSLDAAIINLGNAWKLFQDEIMRGDAGRGLAEVLQGLTDFLRSPEAAATAKAIGKALGLVGQMLRLVTKNLQFILIVFGVSQLSKVPALMGLIGKSIHNLSYDIALGAKNLGLLNGVIHGISLLLTKQLIPGLKALGKAGLVVGKQFLWLTVIAGVLYGIYLLFEDIFMYLTDPTALTMTGELAKKNKGIAESLESIKNTFIDIKPQLESLLPMVAQFLEMLLPVMVKITEWGLWLGINFLDSVLGIVRAFSDWGDKTVTLKDRIQDLAKFLYSVIGVIGGAIAGFMLGGPLGAVIGGVVGGLGGVGVGKMQDWGDKKFKQSSQDFAAFIHPEATQADINKQLRFDGLPTTSNMTMLPNNLTKTETYSSTIYSNPKIYIDAKNKTDEEMIGLFKSALNGDMDNINRQINQGIYSSPVRQGG